MKLLTKLTLLAPLATLATLALPVAAFAAADGAPFAVKGERIDMAPPAGWKLAWMTGRPDGSYLAEYIPQGEDINGWRAGYLAVERLLLPPAELRKKMLAAKLTLPQTALAQMMRKVQTGCGGNNQAMLPKDSRVKGVEYAVSGGFCEQYGPAAPFGEGAVLAIAEGKDYWYRIQFGWRPTAAQPAADAAAAPFRIAPEKIQAYVDAIEAAPLCAGPGQPACRHAYVTP